MMQQQMDTYISWINRQLQEHPRGQSITDLETDMRDGIIFLQLVEVISGAEQVISYDVPLSVCDMRANINRVLEFLSNNNVRVHHISPKEIMEGKMKSIMRLVLALAAHFKPNNFVAEPLDKSFPGVYKSGKKLERTTSLVSMLSNAAASLVDASKNAAGNNFRCNDNTAVIGKLKKPNSLLMSKSLNLSLSVDEPVNIMKLNDDVIPNLTAKFKNRPCPKIQSGSKPSSYNPVNKIYSPGKPSNDLYISTTPDKTINQLKNQPQTSTPKPTSSKPNKLPPSYESHISSKKLMSSSPIQIDHGKFNENEHPEKEYITNDDEYSKYSNKIISYQDEIFDDVTITKSILSELQNLLVNGQTPDESESGIHSFHDDSFEEQLILRNVMLEQKDEECSELKSELNELKEINIQWSGEKVALQTRLSQQEQVILALKFRLLQYEISSKNKNKDELDKTIEEHQKQMHILHGELAMKKDVIHKQEYQINELNTELSSKLNLEASLQSKLEMQETKINCLQRQLKEVTESLHSNGFVEKIRDEANIGALTGRLNEAKFQRDTQKILKEHRNMCFTLSNIRQKFKPEDPINHAFESLQQSMTSLSDTLSLMETTMQAKENHHRILSIPKLLNVSNSICSSDSGYGNYATSDSGERLKLIYYLGKSVTPILKVSDIRLGSFTLRDFKKSIGRSGRYRYFFKSVDSDFGFVREELLYDTDIVPGHENKVVAWLENISDV